MEDLIKRDDALRALVETEEIKGFAYVAMEERLNSIPAVHRTPLAETELKAAFEGGQLEGYTRGVEDGYDEACMDLTDDDLGSNLDEEGLIRKKADCPWQ